MTQPAAKLRSALQFSALTTQKEQLLEALLSEGLRERCWLELRQRLVAALCGWLENPQDLHRLGEAVDLVRESAESGRELQVDLICRVHERLDSSGDPAPAAFRRVDIAPEFKGHSPFEPERIDAAVARSLEWLESQAAADLHPVERCALAMVRFAEIAPFERNNLPSFLLLSAHYLLRDRFVFPVFSEEDRRELDRALAAAISMDMQPLVDLYVQVMDRIYGELLRMINQGSGESGSNR